MWFVLKTFFLGIWNSLHNNPGGLSGRKLSALFAVMAAAYNLRFGETSIAVEMTCVWLGYSLLCLGIITLQQITEFKTGKTSSSSTSTTTKNETTIN